jgi:hypothetical protein
MRQSSDSIGTLAAALAKAQAQLVNPEKTMVATIRPDGRGAAEQTFRYAPLSSGLDTVRKTLGQHEIATVQATAIALTYARRYTLFALVGIAGEDDLDAPDLNTPEPVEPTDEKPPLNPRSRSNGGRNHLGQKASADRVTNKQVSSDNPRLKSQLSAVLRDQLVSELKGVNSTEDAAFWARRSLPARGSLSAEDARRLENAFQSRLARLEGGIDDAERRSEYPYCAGFRAASPHFLGDAPNPTVCKLRGSPRLVGNFRGSRYCGPILSIQRVSGRF